MNNRTTQAVGYVGDSATVVYDTLRENFLPIKRSTINLGFHRIPLKRVFFPCRISYVSWASCKALASQSQVCFSESFTTIPFLVHTSFLLSNRFSGNHPKMLW